MSGRRMGSSCRPCRQARLGCDAALQKGSPCTNCVRRGKTCSPQEGRSDLEKHHRRAVKPIRGGRQVLTSDTRPFISFNAYVSPVLTDTDLENVACRRTQALLLHDMLWDIFISIFESRSALWLGDSCCPYLSLTTWQQQKTFVSRIAIQLDSLQCGSTAGSLLSCPDSFIAPSKAAAVKNKDSAALDDALRYAVYAYSARWLPLQTAFKSSNGRDAATALRKQQDVRDQLWHRARQNVFSAISQPSYRSILTLLLFTTTETPLGNEETGLNHVCSVVLLSHFNWLRLPSKMPQLWPLAYCTPTPRSQLAANSAESGERSDIDKLTHRLHDSMFWLGIVCDTSRSLVHQFPSVILPDASGDRRVWDFIRQRTVIFDQSFRVLHGSSDPLPPDTVVVVLQHASACKTMYMGVLNQFRGALSHQNSQSVEDAAQKVSEETRRFHDVFDPLLMLCARDYLTMNLESQLNYLLLSTHYHLGTLILADILSSLDTIPDSLPGPDSARLQACRAIVNALSLAMNTDQYSQDASPYPSKLLLDPVPELMIQVLSRAGKAIFCLHQSGKIQVQATQIMLSVISGALTVLSKISMTAAVVLSSINQLLSLSELRIKSDNAEATITSTSPEALQLLALCDPDFLDELLQETQIQSCMDPKCLDRTIAKYETFEPTQIKTPEGIYNSTDLFTSCSVVSGSSTLSYHSAFDGANAVHLGM